MKVSKHSLIFGLSYALDIAGKNNLSHSKSTAFLSVLIGKEIGLAEDTVLDIYYAALLHDIGVSNTYIFNEHCVLGEAMLKKLPLSEQIPQYVLYHHEFYNGSGVFGLSQEEIPKGAQIICFASAFDDIFGKSDSFNNDLYLEICEWLDANENLFSKEIVTSFGILIRKEYFLLDYFNHETKYTLPKKIVVNDNMYYDFEDIRKFAGCFADIIDRRSPFTFTHSTGIAKLAKRVTGFLGYDGAVQDKMYIAGLLHDIGKLHVSTDILHKNGKLLPEERFEINKHAYFTRKILEQIEGFEDIVDIAANHHERLDGAGYPYHLFADQINELSRIMAICDVYQALTEERPYRVNITTDDVWNIINGMAENGHLDKDLVTAISGILD